MSRLNTLDKIKVIKLEDKGFNGLSRYKVLVGDIDLANMVTGVKATLDSNTNLVTVNLELVTGDFEWKNEGE